MALAFYSCRWRWCTLQVHVAPSVEITRSSTNASDLHPQVTPPGWLCTDHPAATAGRAPTTWPGIQLIQSGLIAAAVGTTSEGQTQGDGRGAGEDEYGWVEGGV